MSQNVPQYAAGAAYEFIFPNQPLKDFNLGAYYANARSQTLEDVSFVVDGSEFLDHRHIAGGTSQGVSFGMDWVPWIQSLLQA